MQNDEYEIILNKNNSEFKASIQDLGISVVAKDQTLALNKCIIKRDEYISYCKKNNILLPQPSVVVENLNFKNKKFLIFFKFFFNLLSNFIFLCLMLFLLTLFLFNPIEHKLRSTINSPIFVETVKKLLDKLDIVIIKK